VQYTEDTLEEYDNPDAQQIVIYSWKKKTRKLKSPIKINGELSNTFTYNEITEFLDLSTGEIISARNIDIKFIDYGLMIMQRQAILESLRPEVRDIALFVLKFRNKRRGLTPKLDDILVWYAELNNKQVSHVVRYKKRLIGTILAKEDLMKPLFQIAGKNTSATSHLAEDIIASNTLMKEKRRKESLNSDFGV
jgi:hypothetical protein